MNKLKPCPFCGNKMEGYPDYTISFKRDKKKICGIYHEICTLHCNRCTCTIQQAGASKEEAERNVSNVWNARAEMKADDIFHFCPFCDIDMREDPMNQKNCRSCPHVDFN